MSRGEDADHSYPYFRTPVGVVLIFRTPLESRIWPVGLDNLNARSTNLNACSNVTLTRSDVRLAYLCVSHCLTKKESLGVTAILREFGFPAGSDFHRRAGSEVCQKFASNLGHRRVFGIIHASVL